MISRIRRGLARGASGLLLVGAVLAQVHPAGALTTGFSQATFSHPGRIANRYLTLLPGTQFVYDGVADVGNGLLPHRVVLTVTDVTKVVNGVPALAVWDRDYNNGQLVENELAFFAQDDSGRVWNLGEYPEEYENGSFVGAPQTWLSGVDGAQAGIHMLAQPTVGAAYVQGYAPAIDFLAQAKVVKTDQTFCGPRRCYYGVVVIDEFSPLEPDSGHVLKYYARGIGLVHVEPVDHADGEVLDLTSQTSLDSAQLNAARNAVLSLDTRAYTYAADVWQGSPPARVTQDWAQAG